MNLLNKDYLEFYDLRCIRPSSRAYWKHTFFHRNFLKNPSLWSKISPWWNDLQTISDRFLESSKDCPLTIFRQNKNRTRASTSNFKLKVGHFSNPKILKTVALVTWFLSHLTVSGLRTYPKPGSNRLSFKPWFDHSSIICTLAEISLTAMLKKASIPLHPYIHIHVIYPMTIDLKMGFSENHFPDLESFWNLTHS